MDLRRFNELKERFKKAEKFYASAAPQAKKDAHRPELDKVVDELATLYTKLKGKVTLPEVTYEACRMVFNGVEIEYSEELGKWVEL